LAVDDRPSGEQMSDPSGSFTAETRPDKVNASNPLTRNCRQPEERNMHANIRNLLMAAAAISTAPPAFADVITDWNENAVTFVTPRMAPGAAQRVVAIMQVAMFDAVNSIERRYRPYLVQLPAAPTTSKEAAATRGGRHRIGEPHSAGAGTDKGYNDLLSRLDSEQRR
jgi:hypothetical protein